MRPTTLLALVALAGCDLNLFGPDIEYVNRRPMETVPAEYADWYGQVAQCLGIRGNFDRARWFLADSIAFEGTHAIGVTDGDEITVRTIYRLFSDLVRHESAHHITGIGEALHDDDGLIPCADARH